MKNGGGGANSAAAAANGYTHQQQQQQQQPPPPVVVVLIAGIGGVSNGGGGGGTVAADGGGGARGGHQMVFDLCRHGQREPLTRRSLAEIERLFHRLRDQLPEGPAQTKPPKKKSWLQLAAGGGWPEGGKLAERRRCWAEAFLNQLALHLPTNAEVQNLLGPLLTPLDPDAVCLGPSERKTVKPSDFDYCKTIGQGSFGKVYMVRYHGDGQLYAMKVLGKEHIKRRNEVKHVMAERNVLLANVHHPFLVSLHYSFQTRDKLYFVLDFLNGGELFFHLQRERCFSEARARFYAAEVGSALGYLHAKSIIYRDLKPENLLLDRHGHVVLTDFGLCKEGIRGRQTTTTFCGTPEYLAPEVIMKKPYDATVDWWCLGCVLYEMLFGLPPFYSRNQKEMYDRTLNQPLEVPPTATPQVRDLLVEMLRKNRLERLGQREDFEELRVHPFFTPIDWEKLVRRQIRPPFLPKIKSETDVGNIAKEFTDIVPNPASLVPAGGPLAQQHHRSSQQAAPAATSTPPPLAAHGGGGGVVGSLAAAAQQPHNGSNNDFFGFTYNQPSPLAQQQLPKAAEEAELLLLGGAAAAAAQ